MKTSPYETTLERVTQTHIPTGEIFSVSSEHVTYHVPLDAINVANQMRPDDDYGDILELAQSISVLGVKQPVRAYRWDAETAETYLSINNSLYPEKDAKQLEDFTALEDGSYLLLVYGHRRLLASRIAGKDDIPTQIIEDGTIARALEEQTVENIYHPPEPYAFARSINEVYKLQLAGGLVKNQTEFGRKCGVGPDRLRSALRFCSLPWETQEMVIDGDLTYQKAVEIARFMPAIREYERLNTKGEIREEYLDLKVRGELAKHVDYITRRNLPYRATVSYIRNELVHYYGQSELALLNDETRRNYEIQTIKDRTQEMVRESLYNLGNVAVGVRLAKMTDEEAEIQSTLIEPGMQKILGRLAGVATLVGGHAGFTDETRSLAQAALDSLNLLLLEGEPDQAQASPPDLTLL